MTRKVITVRWLWFAIALICCTAVRATPGPEPAAESNPATGPLKPHPANPRYFADGSGKAIYLTGSTHGTTSRMSDQATRHRPSISTLTWIS